MTALDDAYLDCANSKTSISTAMSGFTGTCQSSVLKKDELAQSKTSMSGAVAGATTSESAVDSATSIWVDKIVGTSNEIDNAKQHIENIEKLL